MAKPVPTQRDHDSSSSSSSASPLAARLVEPPPELHDEAMAIAYDDADEWQGECEEGYRANLLAQRIEELVMRHLQAGRLVDPSPPAACDEVHLFRCRDSRPDDVEGWCQNCRTAELHRLRAATGSYEDGAVKGWLECAALIKSQPPIALTTTAGITLSTERYNELIRHELAARVDPSPLAQRTETKDDQARVDKGVNRHGQDLPQPPTE